MEVRATLRLRNNKMIVARQAKGLSQKRLAEKAGVGVGNVQLLERFRYPKSYNEDVVERLAIVLELELEDISPKELAGKNIPADFVQIGEVPNAAILESAERYQSRYILPDPSNEAEVDEMIETIKQNMGILSYRQREILKLRYDLNGEGTEYTLNEVGRIFKVSAETVRQVEVGAIRLLREKMKGATDGET